jgi:hypothetical protein
MNACPYYRETKSVGRAVEQQLRRMRKSLRICQTCVQAEDCPAYQNLNEMIRAAAEEIFARWEDQHE